MRQQDPVSVGITVHDQRADKQRRQAESGSSPVKKRAKTTKSATRKRAVRSDETSDDDDEDSDDDEDEEDEDEAMDEEESAEEEEGDEPVVGRGGKRGAKVSNRALHIGFPADSETQAKKGLKARKKVKKSAKKVKTKNDDDAMDVDGDSALSEAPTED